MQYALQNKKKVDKCKLDAICACLLGPKTAMTAQRACLEFASCYEDCTDKSTIVTKIYRQEAQLSHRDRAMLHFTEYFAKSPKFSEGRAYKSL